MANGFDWKQHQKTERLIAFCYFGLYLAVGLSLLLRQPFGSPPDEYNRYLIPQYIAETGTLPNGCDEEIRIPGYGFSYGFQPILPYMLQGYAMRLAALLAISDAGLLYVARSVNLLLGLLTAWGVLLLSREWFRDRRLGWLFAFLATFLPQAIFVHTYVNTDSCCMLSIALMLYGLARGLKDSFRTRSCLILASGIILCALSYYNAYGYIVSCILLFTASFLSGSNLKFDYKGFFRKGCFLSAIVLCGITWWFLRSAILYDGDFLGLEARNRCALLYADPEFRPDMRVTWQSQGYSLWDMAKDSDFLTLSGLSFIGMYGPMTIVTSIWVYRFYKALFFAGLLACALLPRHPAGDGRRSLRIFYHANMAFCILMPLALSLAYSYSTDYQPQGRYLLPALFPLCFYTVHGLEKIFRRGRLARLTACVCVLLCACIAGMLLLTVYGYAFPYYEAHPIAP